MRYKNILLVDDDIDDTELFLEALNSMQTNAVYRTVSNPKIALAELRNAEQLPDLIFLDYNMPMINGLDFLKQMKSEKKFEQIEVVLISTPPEEFMYAWLKKNDISVEYISKPDNFDEIKEMFSRFVK
ncbi:response regulator [Flavobacterium sp. DG2-3]|uniref:response regulator n=1 Tax=Flavobacterium sp. DG2-3 TaxID=3068317 RepID=UPI00273F9E03|nr:response regulator [Flavobacterium sp. DG2-3]MDP5199099.1 response regulator [Flavobacterium sp. DG2-3]